MRTIRPLILIIAVFGTAIMRAQSPLPVSAVAASRSDAVADTDTRSVRLLVGRSTLVDVTSPISRVSLTSSDVADALVTSPNQLLVNGKIPGISYDGGYADYMIVPFEALAAVPDDLSAEDAAPLLCASITTFNARSEERRVGKECW